jgi:hypothetical protein
MDKKYIIYFDVDDTLTDYSYRLKNTLITNPETQIKQKIKPSDTAKNLEYWTSAEWLPGSKEMVSFTLQNFENVKILSAVPELSKEKQEKTGERFYEAPVKGKTEWINKNIGNIEKIWTKDGKEKANYAKPNTILIDDKLENIQHFEAAGGVGILFDNPQNVIKKLELLLGREQINEIGHYEIKYWALYYNIMDELMKDPEVNYNKLKLQLKGESLLALEYFYATFFDDGKLLLNELSTYNNDIDYKEHIKELTKYYLKKYPNLKSVPKVKFIGGDIENAKTIKTKTGHYDPNTKTITIYVEGRHPRDIVASFSHEFVHFIQDIEGRLNNINTQNTLEDDNLDKIEREAYEEGNIVFRNWKDSLNESKNRDYFGLNKSVKELVKEVISPKNKILSEGVYDSIVNKISNETFKCWKEDFELGLTSSTYMDEYKNELFDKKGRALDFEYIAEIFFTKTEDFIYSVDGGSDAGGGNELGYISLKFEVDPRSLPKKWSEISMDIRDVIRHEIEHLTQGGRNQRRGKEMEDDMDLRTLINNKIIPQKYYYLLDTEIDAMLQGMYLKAKKSHTPFKVVLDQYLDKVGLKPEEKEEVFFHWKKRLKHLSLPLFENLKKEYKIYSDMDGVIVNFDDRFKQYSGGISPYQYEKKFGKDKFWEVVNNEDVGFWVGMDWKDDGKKYWDYIKKYNPIILSAPSFEESSKIGKRLWIKKYLPGVKLVLTPAIFKQRLASPNSILIDDYERNIIQWREAGGIGILHKSAEDTINQLQELGL